MRQIILPIFLFLTGCKYSKQETQKTSVDNSSVNSKVISADTIRSKNTWTGRLNGKKYALPDSLGGRPVTFYLNNPKVASIAKALYKGQYTPTDDDSTEELLSYVTTDDSTIRPFYRWCLDFTISISDGALAEYPGSPALKYAIKFPKEFFDYMDKDPSGQRYKEWTEIIAYSGLLDNYYKKESEIEKDIISKMYNNCYACGNIKGRITTFAKDITKALRLQD